MDSIDFLYSLLNHGFFNDSNLVSLYKLDAETYDYENHKHNEKIEEILKTRNIRKDLAHLLHCPEEQIAYLNEKMDPQVKYLYTGLHIVNLENYNILNGKNVDMKRYLNYKEDKNKEKSSDNLIENCKNNSVIPNPNGVIYRPVIKMLSKEDVKKKIGTAVKCFSLVVTFSLTASAVNSINVEDDVTKYIDSHRYIVNDEKIRTDDNSGYYYLHNNIAKRILDSNEDQDSLIYTVYSEVKQDAATIYGNDKDQIDYNMDLIIRDMSFNSDDYNYNNFDEYLLSKKCVNENGNVDTKMYDQLMREYISNMIENNNFSFDGGKTR